MSKICLVPASPKYFVFHIIKESINYLCVMIVCCSLVTRLLDQPPRAFHLWLVNDIRIKLGGVSNLRGSSRVDFTWDSGTAIEGTRTKLGLRDRNASFYINAYTVKRSNYSMKFTSIKFCSSNCYSHFKTPINCAN
jgi:hypothetical protein